MNEENTPRRRKKTKPTASQRFRAFLIVIAFIIAGYVAVDIGIRIVSGGEQNLTELVIEVIDDRIKALKDEYGSDFLFE